MTNKFFLNIDSGYEGGVDPFISGDLEINNEVYNNPGVMVNQFYLYKYIGHFERAPSFRVGSA
jgi:hypothetical protein